MIDENKKRKIELNLDYKIKKIDNLLNGNTNLELYIESIKNSCMYSICFNTLGICIFKTSNVCFR